MPKEPVIIFKLSAVKMTNSVSWFNINEPSNCSTLAKAVDYLTMFYNRSIQLLVDVRFDTAKATEPLKMISY